MREELHYTRVRIFVGKYQLAQVSCTSKFGGSTQFGYFHISEIENKET